MEDKRIILVTGGTGNQGGAVAKTLLDQDNFEVHILTRDKDQDAVKSLKEEGAIIVEGDLDDRDSLDKALKGVYGVFSMQTAKNGPQTEMRQGKQLADAAKTAGVAHFVYSSAAGAERNTGVARFDSKLQIENHIRTIQIPFTILRPVFFFFTYNKMRQNIENGLLQQPLSPTTQLQQLSEMDFGKMVSTIFKNPKDYIGSSIEVASVSMNMEEVAEAFSDVVGTKVTYRQKNLRDFERESSREMATMYQWFEQEGYCADFNELKAKFGEPQTLRDYLEETGWGS